MTSNPSAFYNPGGKRGYFYGLKDALDYSSSIGYDLVSVQNIIVRKVYTFEKERGGRYVVKDSSFDKKKKWFYLGDNTFFLLDSLRKFLKGSETLFGSLGPIIGYLSEYFSLNNLSWVSYSLKEISLEDKKRVIGKEVYLDKLYHNGAEEVAKTLPKEVFDEIMLDLHFASLDFVPLFVLKQRGLPYSFTSLAEDVERYHREVPIVVHELTTRFGLFKSGDENKGRPDLESMLDILRMMKTSWYWRKNGERLGGTEDQILELFRVPMAHIFSSPGEGSIEEREWTGKWPLLKKGEYSTRLERKDIKVFTYYNTPVILNRDEERYINYSHSLGILPLGKAYLMAEVKAREDRFNPVSGISLPQYPEAEGIYISTYSQKIGVRGFIITDLSVSGDTGGSSFKVAVSFVPVFISKALILISRAREDRRLSLSWGKNPRFPIDRKHRITVLSENPYPLEEGYPFSAVFILSFQDARGTIYEHSYYEAVAVDSEERKVLSESAFEDLLLSNLLSNWKEKNNVVELEERLRNLMNTFRDFYLKGGKESPTNKVFFRNIVKLLQTYLREVRGTEGEAIKIGQKTVGRVIGSGSSDLCFRGSGGDVKIRFGLFLDDGLSLLKEDFVFSDINKEGVSVAKALRKAYTYLFPRGSGIWHFWKLVDTLLSGENIFEGLMESCEGLEKEGHAVSVISKIEFVANKYGKEAKYSVPNVFEPIVVISNREGFKAYVI